MAFAILWPTCVRVRTCPLRLSYREHAQSLGANYEVQFWGGIDLAVDPATEYSVLRANGYPLIITNLSAQLGYNWQAVAVSWRITPMPLQTSD